MDKEKTVLAEQTGLGRIYLCVCDSVHMTIGPVTVALAPETFAKMAAMIHNAMDELSCIADSIENNTQPTSIAESHRSRLTH